MMTNALGIDVEEWYHLCGAGMPVDLSGDYPSRVVENTYRMLALLERLKTKATFFVLGCVAQRFPGIVKAIDGAGHEVASHGHRHLEVFNHSPDSFREDVRNSIQILSGITGKPVLGYRAPGFSIVDSCLWAIDILSEEKIHYDCSIFPVRHPRYGIPTAARMAHRIRPDLIEFPPSTTRIFGANLPVAGGAYWRICPHVFLRAALRQLNQNKIAINSYFHVWETDAKQPRLPLPWDRTFTHYFGLRGSQRKFENILKEFSFAPVSRVIENERF